MKTQVSLSEPADIGIQYCLDIVSNKIPACTFTKQACQRHLNDLARQNTRDFPFVFDKELGSKYVRFMECLTPKTAQEGEKLRLQPWQKWIVTCLFGWVHASGARKGQRMITRAYLECPRGAGKTTLNAAICLASLSLDKQQGAQIICAGKTAEQSRLVLSEAQSMVKRTPKLMATLGITCTSYEVRQDKSNSRMFAISADKKGSQDGKNPSIISIDELHSHSDRSTYDAMDQSLAKRQGALMLVITTAGTDTSSVCYEVRSHLTRILSGEIESVGTWGCIYSIDDDMLPYWNTEEAWRCAQPNYGISIVEEEIRRLAQKAEAVPSAKNAFLTKQLDRWTTAGVGWMDMTAWLRTKDKKLKIEDFKGKKCIIGIDAATRNDICAKVYLFPEMRNGVKHYTVFVQSYLPEAAVNSSRNSQYPGWSNMGLIKVTPGDIIDLEEIERDILNDARNFEVEKVGFDPWNFTASSTRLMNNQINMVEVQCNVKNFSAPMKEIEALVLQGRLHTNDPVLDWCISNVEVKVDQNDNIFPRKMNDRDENKKDLADALIIAMALALDETNNESIYNTQPLFVVEVGKKPEQPKPVVKVLNEEPKKEEESVVSKLGYDPEWLNHGWYR